MKLPWKSPPVAVARLLLLAIPFCTACGDAPTDPRAAASAAPSTIPVLLFSPIALPNVYLMNLANEKVHEWQMDYAPGYSVYLLPNGNLLRATSLPERPFSTLQGSNGGRVEMRDWDNKVVWRYDYATTSGQQHHDVFYMPRTGHVLMVAWERRSADEVVSAGRPADTLPPEGELWVDKVVEVDPVTSTVVWEWRTWDHLVPPGAAPSDHPELIDPTYADVPGVDWTHANAVVYNEALDQVMLSVRNFSEFWVIDHSTTTAEAAGHSGGRLHHGGDLVYRWGNPRAYGLDVPEELYGQHNPQWIADGLPGAGHILIFDNGDAKARPYSRAAEIVPPLQADGSYAYDPVTGYGPAAPVWQYVANPAESFFAPIISGVQRLPSGNTLITDGPKGVFMEVTPEGQAVYSYTTTDTAGNTGYQVFRAVRYEAGYPGLTGRDLTPQGPLRIAVATGSRAPIRY